MQSRAYVTKEAKCMSVNTAVIVGGGTKAWSSQIPLYALQRV
jgi:hypothetical protein